MSSSSQETSINNESSPLLIAKQEEEEQQDNDNNDENDDDDHHTIVEDAAILIEDVVEEVYEIAEAILEEFQEVDDNNTHFLELGLTRNFSILPGDIAEVADQLPSLPTVLLTVDNDNGNDNDNDKDDDGMEKGGGLLVVSNNNTTTDTSANETLSDTTPPFSAYILLLGAVTALSSIGPLLQLQHDATGTLKVIWRMAGTSAFIFPLALMDIYRHRTTKEQFQLLTFPQWMTFLLSTFCYCVMCVCFVLALGYTAVGNAVILSNSLALILLVGKLFVGDPVSFLEGTGALIAFSGAALCSHDSAEAHTTTNTNTDGVEDGILGTATVGSSSSGYYGDALAILAALGGVGYLVCAKKSRKHIPLYLFMFLTMFVGCLMILVFEIFILRETVTFDRHPNHGLWGWLNSNADRLPLEIIIVIICNGLGTMGYVRAMQYFDTLVISSAALAEPVVAELMAVALGVGTLPGVQGWLGNFLVASGTFAVIYEDGRRNKNKNNKDGKSSSLH